MSGFDNGTLWGGTNAQTKQFGSILRGFGPPVPQAGVVGDLYLDTQTWFLYGKRESEGVDSWGNYLFQIPATYRNTLKWFSSDLPADDIGVAGDYCLLWGGYNNYGMQPSIYGPKVADNWPEGGSGPDVFLDAAYVGYALPVGEEGEGTPIAYSTSTQLVVCGLLDEYILAIPIAQAAGLPIEEVGLRSTPANAAVTLNSLYAATDTHAI